MTQSQFKRSPLIEPALARTIAPDVLVIPDQHIDLVPNVGIIVGTDAVLVIDCGIGIENGTRVLNKAKEIAGTRQLWLTCTHFHPEHAFGSQVFKGQATIISNSAQADELQEKGAFYLKLFSDLDPEIRTILADVELVMPDETYQKEKTLDLGGKRVILRELPGHTRGDQIIFLPDEQVLFTGDLAENRLFPIFPDQDAHSKQWIEALAQMINLTSAIVVPGHGEIGTTHILQEVQEQIAFVQEEISQRIKTGKSLELIEQEAAPIIKERYAQWGNDQWIPLEIRSVYAEVTGTPLLLPEF